MLLVPGHQLHLDVSISHQKPRMLLLHYVRQCKSVFQLHNSFDTVTAGFLKCLVYVFKLWEPQNKVIIGAKPSVTPILLAAILWPTRVITDRVCKPRSDWLVLCYFHHDFSSHLVRRVGHVLLKSEVTSHRWWRHESNCAQWDVASQLELQSNRAWKTMTLLETVSLSEWSASFQNSFCL